MDPRPLNPGADLGARVRSLYLDLSRAQERLATGRLRPDQFAKLERVLTERLDALEAEVHARYLRAMQHGTRLAVSER